ncbi:MAG TPA: hypothetical protein VF234_08795 [Limnochordia bacterium]
MKPFGPFLDGYHDVADQLARHLGRRADAACARHAAQKAAMRTPSDFEARRQRLREGMLEALGGLPELPPAVAARCTGVIDCGEFTIEKLLLESLPDVYVTANLYVPAGVGGPRPGVLFVCGHAKEAKAYPEYQRVLRALVRAGLIVLAIDPVGQGERLQYLDPDTGEELVRWGTAEHSHAGFQCHLVGHSIARYFIADGMQALSYLASRPEVDASRLGITGNSGGGTQSSYLMCLDDRLSCGAPCTYITSRSAYMATGQAHDSEQNLHRALTMGLDYGDLIGGLAPKPVMIGAVASDFFCIEGTMQSFERLRDVYRLYGREDHLYLVVAPGMHRYAPLLREHVVRFFRRYLLGEAVELDPGCVSLAAGVESPLAPRPSPEPAEEAILPPEALQVTARGQVVLEYDRARTIFDLNLAAWEAKRRRARPDDGADGRERLRARIVADRPRPPLWVREVRAGSEGGIRWAHRFTFSEPDIAVPMIELSLEDAPPQAPLTVAAIEGGTDAVARHPERVRALVRETGRLLLFDPRGTGAAAQRPVNPHPVDGLYGTLYKLNYDAMMLGDSLFAMQAFDALRVLEYAHRIAASVHIFGEGSAGLVLLAAAVIDGEVAGGRLEGLLRSFEELITDRFFVPDYTLEVFGLADGPDVSEMLAWLPQLVCSDRVNARGERASA